MEFVRVKLAFVVVFLFAANLPAQAPRSMDDPLFAIRYDPQSVKFENLPSSLLKQCSNLKGRYKGVWVYGHAKTPDAEYFIVSGLLEDFDEEKNKYTGHFSPDETGIIIAVSGSTCAAKAEDDLYWVKDSPIWDLSQATLNALVADIFRRYSDAFGGKRRFLSKIPKDRSFLGPEFRTRLDAFEKQP
jgi:hypothetical protein